MLIPLNLEEMIPQEHLVRQVDEIINRIDTSILDQQYEGGGTSAYHPVMLLKIILYAYSQRIFSSRRIAKALRENIHFLWLSRMNQPDFRTVNRFRGVILRETIENLFSQLVEELLNLGLVDFEQYFVDGTKMEANANKYSFVWKKSTENYKGKLQEKVKALLDEVDQEQAWEDEVYGDRDLNEVEGGKDITSEDLQRVADKLNEVLRREPGNKKAKQAKKQLETDFIPRQKKYEHYEAVFEGRNSFSRIDPDATFMRMKEDHMRNGQLKAGYNIQTGTQNQFIVNYSLHRRAGDTSCLQAHLEKFHNNMGLYPENLIADAGYGSEENYAYLEKRNIAAYVKYQSFHYEQKRNYRKKKPYRAENMPYDAEKDEYTCPQGKKLRYIDTKRTRSENGFVSERRIYECEDCSRCPVKEACTRAKNNRRILRGEELNRLRQAAHDRLMSPRGVKHRRKRGVEVEAVFGQIKQNMGFRRFMLRGLENVSTEWGIVCMAHNLSKIARAS